MSNQVALHNTHKSYDSIITPSDDSELLNNSATENSPTPLQQQSKQTQSQSVDDFTSDNTDSRLLKRTNSLDSLVNSEQNSSIDEISDSDSLCELKRLSSLESKSTDLPRKSDLEEIKNIDEQEQHPNEPVIKAFLEKSHQYGCDYENCGYKKSEEIQNNSINEKLSVRNNNYLLPPSPAVKLNRKSSLVNSEAIRRMETILEEPIEPKISVKEILARFETMRETAEVTINVFKSLNILMMMMVFD
jgi:hypothetical protein